MAWYDIVIKSDTQAREENVGAAVNQRRRRIRLMGLRETIRISRSLLPLIIYYTCVYSLWKKKKMI